MTWLCRLLSDLSVLTQRDRPAARKASPRWRPALEALEERWQPSGVSTITSNFNGTAIAAGDTVWFNSVAKVSGLGSTPVELHVVNASIDFTANGTSYHVAVPDADVRFSPTATAASTVFDTATNTWETTVPSNAGGNVFLAGVALQLPNGLPGGINPVTWTATFQSDTAGVSVNWQWAAAVYSNFSADYTTVGVKPVDSNQLSVYKNSDHAGTPEAFTEFVHGGARGGGGSNFTGSYSGTGHATADVVTPPATLSGSVTDTNGNPVGSIQFLLTNTTTMQQFSVYSTANGTFSFSAVPPGTYTLQEVASGYTPISSTPGMDQGGSDGTSFNASTITEVTLVAGDSASNFDFEVKRLITF